MKKIAYAVIGAGYGDEGKGLMTDYLVRKFTDRGLAPINVRYNGGGQAGHTVVCDIGRHVFSHVGAGSFAHASTFLSSNFVINPIILKRELEELKLLGVQPRIEAHPDCNVTTVFDIVLNALRELSRGDARHGSCGVGINETITRATAGFSITAEDTRSSRLVSLMRDTLENWWTPQLTQINFANIDPVAGSEFMKLWDIDIAVNALRTLDSLLPALNHAPFQNHSLKDTFIFEGAQGLELDEYLGEFPHVTRSQTGLEGALHAAASMGITEITPVYVTRAYKTRHGAGPLPHEGDSFTDKKIVDKTNVLGEWQGSFRYAPLDIPRLADIIDKDLLNSRKLADRLRIKINQPELAVTWLDKVGDRIKIYGQYDEWHDDLVTHKRVTREELIQHLAELDVLHDSVNVRYLSYGETAKTIKEIDNE